VIGITFATWFPADGHDNVVMLSVMVTVPTAVLSAKWKWAYYHWQLYGFIGKAGNFTC